MCAGLSCVRSVLGLLCYCCNAGGAYSFSFVWWVSVKSFSVWDVRVLWDGSGIRVQGSFKAAEVSVGREERGRKGYRGILLVVRHTHTIQIPFFTQHTHTFEHCPFSPRTILSRTQSWTGPLPGSGGRHDVLFVLNVMEKKSFFM